MEASWPPTRSVLRVILIILIVLVTLWMIIKLTGVILLVVLSIFFAYFVSPLVEFLSRPIRIGSRKFGIPRALAIGLAYVIIVAINRPIRSADDTATQRSEVSLATR